MKTRVIQCTCTFSQLYLTQPAIIYIYEGFYPTTPKNQFVEPVELRIGKTRRALKKEKKNYEEIWIFFALCSVIA